MALEGNDLEVFLKREGITLTGNGSIDALTEMFFEDCIGVYRDAYVCNRSFATEPEEYRDWMLKVRGECDMERRACVHIAAYLMDFEDEEGDAKYSRQARELRETGSAMYDIERSLRRAME